MVSLILSSAYEGINSSREQSKPPMGGFYIGTDVNYSLWRIYQLIVTVEKRKAPRKRCGFTHEKVIPTNNNTHRPYTISEESCGVHVLDISGFFSESFVAQSTHA